MEYEIRDKKIYIYGAASYGKRVYDILGANGYPATAFIDRRATEIREFLGKKVFLPEEFFNDTENCEGVIFIAIKNVFEHSKIALSFMNKGIKRIIFRPLSVLMGGGSDAEKVLNDIYSYIDDGNFTMIDRIPEAINDKVRVFNDRMLICEENDEVVVNIPWQFVFTDKKDTHQSEWMDVNIGAMYPHISFFKYLLGSHKNGEGYEDYLRFCVKAAKRQGDIKITKQWKENVIRNRKMVFKQMNLAYELDKDFFVRNAPKARWNSQEGHFNLKSGKHRATFLLAKGNKFIPLKIGNEDYKEFRNDLIVEMIHFREGEVKRILHPMLFDPMFDEWDFWDLTEKAVLSYLSRKSFIEKGALNAKEKSILIGLSNDAGSVSRNFAIFGFNVSRFIDSDIEEIKLVDALHYKKDKIKTISDLKSILNEKYDYIFLDTLTVEKCGLKFVEIVNMNYDKLFLMCNEGSDWCDNLEVECIFDGLLELNEKNLYVISNKEK